MSLFLSRFFIEHDIWHVNVHVDAVCAVSITRSYNYNELDILGETSGRPIFLLMAFFSNFMFSDTQMQR